MDTGIVKCKGRLNNSNLPPNSRNPILLPAKHQFVRLVIKDMHELTKRSGIRDTLVTSRERFWILRGREAVKQIIRKCVICRRYEGTQYRSQPSSDLPSERVSEDPPFTHVGLDFARALFIGDRNSTERANESSKVYVVPVHLCVGPSSSLGNDPRSQRSNIPISLQTICESTRATSNADLRQR